jgi:hypothetical protein
MKKHSNIFVTGRCCPLKNISLMRLSDESTGSVTAGSTTGTKFWNEFRMVGDFYEVQKHSALKRVILYLVKEEIARTKQGE